MHWNLSLWMLSMIDVLVFAGNIPSTSVKSFLKKQTAGSTEQMRERNEPTNISASQIHSSERQVAFSTEHEHPTESAERSASIALDTAADFESSTLTPRNLQTEYFEHFERCTKPFPRRWIPVRILKAYHEEEAVSKICQSAYLHSHPSASGSADVVPPTMLSCTLHFPVLVIKSADAGEILLTIDVLTCKTDAAEIFYITKGRRDNSVYFVKPTKLTIDPPLDFVLDDNYASDVELEFQLTEFAESAINKRIK